MNYKVVGALSIIGVIILVVIFFATKPAQQVENSLSITTPQAVSFENVDKLAGETSSWSTFVSKDKSFSFKVPPTWTPEEISGGGALIKQPGTQNAILVEVSFSGKQTAQELVENVLLKPTKPDEETEKEALLKSVKIIPTILNDRPAYRIEGLATTKGQLGSAIWIPNDKGNGIYIQSSLLKDNTFDSFLQTFKSAT